MRREAAMLRWRREAILDIYTLMLGAYPFLTPWLFAYAHEPAGRRRLGEQRTLGGDLARHRARLRGMGRMGDHDPRAPGGCIALAPRFRAREGDADHRPHRRGDRLPERARAVAHPL